MPAPIPVVGSYDLPPDPHPGWGGLIAGTLDEAVAEWVACLSADGHATTHVHRPDAHYIIGSGPGHQDDTFADIGVSHAAYTENTAYLAGGCEIFGADRAADRADRTGRYADRQAAVYAALVAAFARARADSRRPGTGEQS